MVLRWFKKATDLKVLARDAAVSIVTLYVYLHYLWIRVSSLEPGG